MFQKRMVFAIGVIIAVFIIMVITHGRAWIPLVVGTMGFFIYRNNRT